MYKFKYKERFNCDAKTAFAGTTGDFAGIEKYVPNITKVEILSHEVKDGGDFRWLLKFHGDGSIPLVARAVIRPDMLCWNEELLCDPRALAIDWKIETYFFKEHFKCGGHTTYIDLPGGSEMIVDGFLNVTLSHLPGFPDHLVKRAVAAFEPFVGKFVEPNLSRFYKAMKKRMADRGELK